MINFNDCYKISEEFFPKTKKRTFRKRIRFLLKIYFAYRPTIQKIASFFAETPLRSFLLSLPGFKEHIYKQQVGRFLYCNSNKTYRQHFLFSHFNLLERTHTEESIKQIYTQSLPPLSVTEGENTLSFRISYEYDMSREGLLLLLVEMNGVILYKIAFWLMDYECTATLCIGALQGGKNTLETNRIFTKEFWGLRPQNMAIMALRCYAQAIGIEQIFTFPQKTLWSKKISEQTALDEFWQEQGATAITRTPFIKLALHIPHKDISEIASRKRSMYKKRYDFLDKLNPVLVAGFKQHTKSIQANQTTQTVQSSNIFSLMPNNIVNI